MQVLTVAGSRLWILGMAVMLVFAFAGLLRLRKKTREAVCFATNPSAKPENPSSNPGKTVPKVKTESLKELVSAIREDGVGAIQWFADGSEETAKNSAAIKYADRRVSFDPPVEDGSAYRRFE